MNEWMTFSFLTDVVSDVDGELSVKHILLEASGQIQLHRTVANVSCHYCCCCCTNQIESFSGKIRRERNARLAWYLLSTVWIKESRTGSQRGDLSLSLLLFSFFSFQIGWCDLYAFIVRPSVAAESVKFYVLFIPSRNPHEVAAAAAHATHFIDSKKKKKTTSHTHANTPWPPAAVPRLSRWLDQTFWLGLLCNNWSCYIWGDGRELCPPHWLRIGGRHKAFLAVCVTDVPFILCVSQCINLATPLFVRLIDSDDIVCDAHLGPNWMSHWGRRNLSGWYANVTSSPSFIIPSSSAWFIGFVVLVVHLQKRWSVGRLAALLAGVCHGVGIGARPPLHDLADPSIRSLSIDRAIQVSYKFLIPSFLPPPPPLSPSLAHVLSSTSTTSRSNSKRFPNRIPPNWRLSVLSLLLAFRTLKPHIASTPFPHPLSFYPHPVIVFSLRWLFNHSISSSFIIIIIISPHYLDLIGMGSRWISKLLGWTHKICKWAQPVSQVGHIKRKGGGRCAHE